MATTSRGRDLTEAHRLAQIQVGARTEAQLAGLWDRIVDIRAINESVNVWIDTVKPVIAVNADISGGLAAEYVTDYADAEAPGGYVPIVRARPPSFRLIGASLDIEGREAVWVAAKYRPLPDALAVARARAAGKGQELVLNVGRSTILDSVRASAAAPIDIRKATGWRRITDFDPCKFCTDLASRGIEAPTADRAGFKAHPKCGCTAEPIF